MSRMIVANGVEVFYKEMLTEQEIHQWRYDSYQDLTTRRRYSLRDIQALNAELPSESMVISTMMLEKMNQGKKVVFMAFDSSTVCDVDVLKMIEKIKAEMHAMYDQEIYLVFVDTYISLIENKYKLANVSNYKCVNPKYLKKYVKFVESHSTGEYEGNNGIDFIYKVDFMTASKTLSVEEWRPIVNPRGNKKNEQNDNAQLDILSDLRGGIKDIACLMLSHDKGMLGKCKKMHIVTCIINDKKKQLYLSKND